MSDGKIIYEVRVESDSISRDMNVAEQRLQNSTFRLNTISKIAAQTIGELFSSVIGTQSSRLDTLLNKLSIGFSSLASTVNPLKAALMPVAELLSRISQTDLSKVTSSVSNITKATQFIAGGITASKTIQNSHRTGKEYVPYDEYPALLHKGEAVLTAAENEILRANGGIDGLLQPLPPNVISIPVPQQNTPEPPPLNQTLNIHVELDGYQVAKAVARSAGELNRQMNAKVIK